MWKILIVFINVQYSPIAWAHRKLFFPPMAINGAINYFQPVKYKWK